MFVILWQYEVHETATAAFRDAYGPNGDWARLFARGEGYRGTELLSDLVDPTAWVTLDRWASQATFEAFQQRFGDDYAALDARFEALTLSETRIGAFTTTD